MERIGHGWRVGAWDVYQEHQATQIVASALVELIDRTATGRDGPPPPLAIGATPRGTCTSSRACSASWPSASWAGTSATSARTCPLPSLARRSATYRPRLVFLSVSHLADPERFVREYADVPRGGRARPGRRSSSGAGPSTPTSDRGWSTPASATGWPTWPSSPGGSCPGPARRRRDRESAGPDGLST